MAQGGSRSELAYWIGGASGTPSTSTGGFRSFLGLWIGGANNHDTTPPPPTGNNPPRSHFIANNIGRFMIRSGS